MAYLVLARKHRPQSFEEVVQQEHISVTLGNAIRQKRVAHAILFAGPRGTGKTTVARILAKAMNCEKGPTAQPCQQCQSCREITAGSAADVYEIDGASNNSVEQVRELRENLRYMPSHSTHKIYIVDEVHMLSTAAFNALLKTLEEPPAHVLFFLATTEAHKIPITILSRCQRHDFRRIDIESIRDHLEKLCQKEGISLDVESLGVVARESGGSMRDALSLLDQLIAGGTENLNHQQVLQVLGAVDRTFLFDLTDAVLSDQPANALRVIEDVYNRGYDLKKFYADLLEQFRNLMLAKMSDGDRSLVDLPVYEIDRLHQQARPVAIQRLNRLFDVAFAQEAAIRYAAQPRLALEMMVIRMLQVPAALPVETLIEKLSELRQEFYGAMPEPVQTAGQTAPAPERPAATAPASDDPAPAYVQPEAPPAVSVEAVEQAVPAMDAPDENDLPQCWQAMKRIVESECPALAPNLGDAGIQQIDADQVVLWVRGKDFNISMVRRPKNISILSQVCSRVLGRPVQVAIEGAVAAGSHLKEKALKTNHLTSEALQQPAVADALEIFHGDVHNVKIPDS